MKKKLDYVLRKFFLHKNDETLNLKLILLDPTFLTFSKGQHFNYLCNFLI